LTFKNNPDYEIKTSYDLNLTVSDGVQNSSKAITITLNNLNDTAPVITSSSVTVDENQLSVLTVTKTDADNLVANVPVVDLEFPLTHPTLFQHDIDLDRVLQVNIYTPSIQSRVISKITRKFKHC
jgi:hypothetical protein